MSPIANGVVFNRDTTLTDYLKKIIQQANNHHENEQFLMLYAHRFTLQPKQWLASNSEQNLEHKLVSIIIQYGDYLPTLITEFNHYCEQHGWQEIATKASTIVASFFEKIDRANGQEGLVALLDKIYFSHRMYEELHDHLMCKIGVPATAWNMTTVNLLIHQMLGAQYSARLDQSAIQLANKLIESVPECKSSRHKKGQPNRWPCFCEQQGLNIAF